MALLLAAGIGAMSMALRRPVAGHRRRCAVRNAQRDIGELAENSKCTFLEGKVAGCEERVREYEYMLLNLSDMLSLERENTEEACLALHSSHHHGLVLEEQARCDGEALVRAHVAAAVLRVRLGDTERQLEEERARSKQLEAQLASSRAAADGLRLASRGLQVQVQEAHGQAEGLRAELVVAAAAAQEAQQQLAALRQEALRLVAQAQVAQQDLEAAEEHAAWAGKQVQELGRLLRSTRGCMDRHSATEKELREELGAARAEAARFRRMSGDSFKRWCAQQARSGAVGLMAQLEPDFLASYVCSAVEKEERRSTGSHDSSPTGSPTAPLTPAASCGGSEPLPRYNSPSLSHSPSASCRSSDCGEPSAPGTPAPCPSTPGTPVRCPSALGIPARCSSTLASALCSPACSPVGPSPASSKCSIVSDEGRLCMD